MTDLTFPRRIPEIDVAAVLAVSTNLLRLDPANVVGSVLAETRLLSTSATYVTALLLVLRAGRPQRPGDHRARLGRMALTCFLTQAAAAVAVAAFVDVRGWNFAAVTFGGTAVFVAAGRRVLVVAAPVPVRSCRMAVAMCDVAQYRAEPPRDRRELTPSRPERRRAITPPCARRAAGRSAADAACGYAPGGRLPQRRYSTWHTPVRGSGRRTSKGAPQ